MPEDEKKEDEVDWSEVRAGLADGLLILVIIALSFFFVWMIMVEISGSVDLINTKVKEFLS